MILTLGQSTAFPKLFDLPLTLQLGYRLAHVLRRLLPVAMFLLQVSEPQARFFFGGVGRGEMASPEAGKS